MTTSYNTAYFTQPLFSATTPTGTLGGGLNAPLYSWAISSYAPNGDVLWMTDSVMGSWGYTYDSLSRLLTAQNPESGTTSYVYSMPGSLCAGDISLPCTKTDATNMTITYTYDALNRMLTKTAPDGGNTNDVFVYDQGTNGIGRLYYAVTWNLAGTIFSYDPMGRVANTQWFNYNAGQWQTGMAASYDLAGDATQLTYPDGRVVNQTWDGAGRLSTVTDATLVVRPPTI